MFKQIYFSGHTETLDRKHNINYIQTSAHYFFSEVVTWWNIFHHVGMELIPPTPYRCLHALGLIHILESIIDLTNPRTHLFHIPQCPIQNRNEHISVLNGTLWDMKLVYSGICKNCLFGVQKYLCLQCMLFLSEIIVQWIHHGYPNNLIHVYTIHRRGRLGKTDRLSA